jgi:hypothetical protein
MTAADRLRLLALDVEDLAVVSAHVQDAVLRVGDLLWFPSAKQFVVSMNRFAWETRPERRLFSRRYERRRAVLHFDRVLSAASSGVETERPDAVLALLAVTFEPGDAPSGHVLLAFAGGATIRLSVECIEASLSDLGPAWATAHAPRHRGT